MLKVAEVANRLRVSPGMVYKLIKRGDLGCHRIGTTIRIAESQLGEYLDRTCEENGDDPRRIREFKHLKV